MTNLCHVPISIDKFYQDSVACDVVDVDAFHILLGRPWQHDIDATHRGKEDIYVFPWKGKRVSMRPISPAPKATKEEEPKYIFICNQGESSMESKKTKQGFDLLVKKVTPPAEIHQKVEQSLEVSKGVIHDELPEGLPPMKNIQP